MLVLGNVKSSFNLIVMASARKGALSKLEYCNHNYYRLSIIGCHYYYCYFVIIIIIIIINTFVHAEGKGLFEPSSVTLSG